MLRKLDGTKPGGLDDMDINYATTIKFIRDTDLDPTDHWLTDYRWSNKQYYYKYLDEMNRGKVNGEKYRNSRYYTKMETKHIPEAIADSLDLSPVQKSTAISGFKSLNHQENGIDKVLVAYCTCAYVTHRDAEARKCHPQTKEKDMDPYFERVRKNLNITQREFDKTYGKVRSQLGSH